MFLPICKNFRKIFFDIINFGNSGNFRNCHLFHIPNASKIWNIFLIILYSKDSIQLKTLALLTRVHCSINYQHLQCQDVFPYNQSHFRPCALTNLVVFPLNSIERIIHSTIFTLKQAKLRKMESKL